MSKVIILGGGIGGLSAAHELVKRKFDVEVYEYHEIPGGKARSIPVEDGPQASADGCPCPGHCIGAKRSSTVRSSPTSAKASTDQIGK